MFLHGKVFADAIKLRILKWRDYLGLHVCLQKGDRRRFDMNRGGGNVTMKAKNGAMQPHGKE